MSKGEALKVFISSTMVELRDVREIVERALRDKGIRGRIYEKDVGASPLGVEDTSLFEVEQSDVYVGLFWKEYGEITIKEYRQARDLRKPCFVYIRDKDVARQPLLDNFLKTEVYDLRKGVTSAYFNSAVELAEKVASDIIVWLVQQYREGTAAIRQASVSKQEIARFKDEVTRLQAISLKRLPVGTDADYLARQMRAWFDALGYHFERHEVRTGRFFQWIINVPARRGYDRILVQGVQGEGNIGHVNALRKAMSAEHTQEGWLVAPFRISAAAHAEAKRQSNVFCYAFDELLEQDADFTRYFDWLNEEVRRRRVDRNYVKLVCIKDEIDPETKEKLGESRYDQENGWIDGYVNRWLGDPSKEHLSILGEFGTGKTWFALHYAWQLMQKYCAAQKEGGARPRLPLIISLRDYSKALTIETLLSDFFFHRHEVPLRGYSAFEQLNRMGKLLIIFDGFDEMAARVDRQMIIDNFWELARVVVPGAKVILTCRTEHFPEAKEGRALLGAELRASTSKLTVEPPQFETLYLEKLNDAQIQEALSLQVGPFVVKRVIEDSKLLDLARRPIMIEFLLEALDDIKAGKPADLSRVYLYALRRKMERDIVEGRTLTSLADKLYFLCELSWEMFSTDKPSLNYRLIPDRIRRLFGPEVREEKNLDYWRNEMTGHTLLVRNADGDYTLAHRSLMEFFVAYKLAAELGLLDSDFTDLARHQSHVDNSVAPHDASWTCYFLRELDEMGNVICIPPLNTFSPEPIRQVGATFGNARLSGGIIELLMPMLRKGENTESRLLDLIKLGKRKEENTMNYAGGNAASLLVRIDKSVFKGRRLLRAMLRRANLMCSDLENAQLIGVDLMSANLAIANLKGATCLSG